MRGFNTDSRSKLQIDSYTNKQNDDSIPGNSPKDPEKIVKVLQLGRFN